MSNSSVFTSESVTEGHPDKLCDVISDAIVDRYLTADAGSRITAECAVSKGVVFIAARFASEAHVDIPEVAREAIRRAGYTEPDFNADDATVVTSLTERPPQERRPIDTGADREKLLAQTVVENQITVFGFACDQTEAYLPLPIWLSRRLAQGLTQARVRGDMPYLSPDGTTQVGVEYRRGRPLRIHSLTVIAGEQGKDSPPAGRMRSDLVRHVLEPVFADEALRPDHQTGVFINPRGRFPVSGPAAHSGMTGRKTTSDTYGGYSRLSGSALSGKDPLRVDRVGAYIARHAAKNLVAASLANECEVQLSYAIGQCAPVGIQLRTFGTGHLDEEMLLERVCDAFDFRLGAIVGDFDLQRRPQRSGGIFYQDLARHGHVGRTDVALPWELTERAGALMR